MPQHKNSHHFVSVLFVISMKDKSKKKKKFYGSQFGTLNSKSYYLPQPTLLQNK